MKKLVLALVLLIALIIVGCQSKTDAPQQDASKTSQSYQNSGNSGGT